MQLQPGEENHRLILFNIHPAQRQSVTAVTLKSRSLQNHQCSSESQRQPTQLILQLQQQQTNATQCANILCAFLQFGGFAFLHLTNLLIMIWISKVSATTT